MAFMARIKMDNMLRFYALFSISNGPKHGYDLIKDLESKFGRKISASNVYPFLEILRKNRLVRVGKTGKRDKKVYYLTPDGKKFAGNMFNRFGDLIAIAIEPKIATCPCGCRIYSGGYPKKIKGKIMKFCCSHCAKMHH